MAVERDLYHYTTAGGLAGILTTASIYGTHMAYLNDAEEMMYGLQVSRDIFDSDTNLVSLSSIDIQGNTEVVRRVMSRLQRETATRLEDKRRYPFVSCFSAEGDQLSQWRGYAEDGGYAIQFDAKLLRRSICRDLKTGESRPDPMLMTEERYLLHQVSYGIEGSKKHVRDIVNGLVPPIIRQQNEPEDSPHDHVSMGFEYGLNKLQEVMPLIKNPAFKEEREFRILSYFPSALRGEPCFFPSPSRVGLIPRVRLKFDPHCVRGIVVGPGEFMELRSDSVTEFIDAHRDDYPYTDVIQSDIPYRAI
jgi:hypothetical protein